MSAAPDGTQVADVNAASTGQVRCSFAQRSPGRRRPFIITNS